MTTTNIEAQVQTQSQTSQHTLHSICGIDVKTKQIDYKLIRSYIKQGVTHLIIDEISMIPSWIWNILAHMKHEYGFIVIGAGDWGQLPAVGEDHIDFENSWIVKCLRLSFIQVDICLEN